MKINIKEKKKFDDRYFDTKKKNKIFKMITWKLLTNYFIYFIFCLKKKYLYFFNSCIYIIK